MSENEFAKLLERAYEGHEEAQMQLYFEYGPHIRRVIKRRLRDLNIEWAVDPEPTKHKLCEHRIRLMFGGVCLTAMLEAVKFGPPSPVASIKGQPDEWAVLDEQLQRKRPPPRSAEIDAGLRRSSALRTGFSFAVSLARNNAPG